MDRKKWDIAIRCLEVALHPNTSDDEVIAGVNGFRRTAGGTPLSEVARAFAGSTAAPAPGLPENAARLSRENLDLRRKVETGQAEQAETLRRLHEAERRIRELSAEIRAAEEDFEAFRRTSSQLVDGLKDENVDLRGALDQARADDRTPAGAATSPFGDLLAAALGQTPRPSRAPTVRPPHFPHPWTA